MKTFDRLHENYQKDIEHILSSDILGFAAKHARLEQEYYKIYGAICYMFQADIISNEIFLELGDIVFKEYQAADQESSERRGDC